MTLETNSYRLVASNGTGASRGADATVTTRGAPEVVTGPATASGLATRVWVEVGRRGGTGYDRARVDRRLDVTASVTRVL